MSSKKISFFVVGTILIIALVIATGEAGRHSRRDNEHCECHYQPDKKGCIIARGPDLAGYKCRCRISRFFLITHCVGTRIQCSQGENCPAQCSSKECCSLAGGDCNGY